MRMGRPPPKRKAPSARKTSRTRKADTQNPRPPQFSSPTLVVGQVHPNVVASVLAPRLTALAVTSVEAEAARALWAAAALPEGRDAEEGGTEGGEEGAAPDPDGDGAERHGASSTGPPPSSKLLLFQTQSDIDTLATLLSETSSHFTTGSAHRQLSSWRVGLNAAKFERLLDERYGRFRPLIEAHPQIEVVLKNLQRRYALGGCSPFKDKLPVSTTTGVMLLFMLHRQKVRTDALVLAAVFCLVGLQPWALVTLVALGRWEAMRRKGGRTRGMPRKLTVCRPYYARGAEEEAEEGEEAAATARKHALLARPVGAPYNPADLSLRDAEHDALVLGGGAAALYAGALLARAGRRVCVLSPEADASGCATMGPYGKRWTEPRGPAPAGRGDRPFAAVPFDVGAHAVAHLSRQQPLLAPALCTAADAQGGVRFARVGSPADGYAHTLVSVPGPGGADAGWEDPAAVTAGGAAALAEHCAARLGDGRPGRAGPDLGGGGGGGGDAGGSASLGYLRACATVAEAAGDHYLSKLLPPAGKADAGGNAYRQAALRPAAAFLDACLPLSPRVRALAAGLGNPNENAGPGDTSLAAHVSHLCANTSEEGLAYPVGGPRALCHALASVIEQCGGRVVTGVGPQELLFEKMEEEEKTTKKKEEKKEEEKEGEKRDGAGEALSAGPKPRCRGVRLPDGCELAVADGGAVVSLLGLIPTFLHFVPPPVRAAHGVPPGLPALAERRPLLRVLVGLRGAAADLDVTGADWYRLPNATAAPGDGAADGDGEEAEGRGRGKRSKGAAAAAAPRRTKFTAGKSWMKVSFPSAKDPSWPARHAAVTTCVVTIEADDDFVTAFDTRPRIFSILKFQEGAATRLVDRVIKDLVENFPQLADTIECVQLCGPLRAGVAQNPARFAIAGNRPESPYPGLFVGGADLTVADSFSGAIAGSWLAANAVVGYSSVDLLYLQKNITSDLAQFLEQPDGDGEEDLAVPFEGKGARGDGCAAGRKGKEVPTDPAESSKEE